MSDDEDTKDLLPDKPPDQKINSKSDSKIQSGSNMIHYIFMTVLSSIVGLLFGYESGLGVNNLPKLKNTISLDCTEQNAIITSWIVGAFLSSIIGGTLVDRFGPRTVLSFTSSLLFTCSLLATFTDSFIIFLSSRILAGFGGCLLLMAQYVHVMNTAITKKYQLLLLISVFSTVSYLILVFMSFAQISWRTEFGLTSILSGIAFISLLLQPASVQHFNNSPKIDTKYSTTIYSSKVVQTILLSVALTICCELMGHTTVRYYSPIILGMFGVCKDYQQNMASIILNNLRAISTIILMFSIDKVGRRCSIILGTLIMTITLLLLGVFSMNDIYNSSISIQDNFWMNDQAEAIENCHRIILGTDTSYIIEPSSFSQNKKTLKRPSLNEAKTPYPFLPTPLAMTAQTQTANGVDFLFDCKHNIGPWTDESLPSKATKLITIFLYESGNALSASFMYWIIFCEIAPQVIRGRLMGFMMGIHWLGSLIYQSLFANFLATFTLSSIFFLHSIACFIGLLVSFILLPEDHIPLNDQQFYFHSMLNNLKFISGHSKPRNADVKVSQSTAI